MWGGSDKALALVLPEFYDPDRWLLHPTLYTLKATPFPLDPCPPLTCSLPCPPGGR